MTRESGRRRERRTTGGIHQLPWRTYRNPYEPIEVLSADHLEAIHETSLRILGEHGVEFLDAEALALLKGAGADVGPDGVVRFDRGLVMACMAKVPSEVTLHARNPARNLTFGGNHINFGTVASAPNVSDLDRGRRPGSFQDYCDLLRLAQSLNIVQFISGYPVEPADLPPSTRHLDAHYAAITLTDRIWHPYSLGKPRISDAIEMIRIARGFISKDQLKREPSLFSIVNSNSPRRLDGPMIQGLLEMSRHGQPIVLTPFTLSGAMAPATIAGALAQQNAEALAGIALIQIAAPGAPCMYGGFTSNVDMKSGAPAFGTPEYTRAALAGGQLARRYRIPYRSSNACAANAVDAQAAYESEMSIWGAVMGGANLVKHGAGWMEGGLVASFEKLIVDAEMLQMMGEFLQPIVVDEDSLALAAIAEVDPGGHYFGAQHTLAHYESAFYAPMVSDWRNFETWREAGAVDAAHKANAIWKQLLADYQPPPLDPAIDEALREFVAKRKAEGGVPA